MSPVYNGSAAGRNLLLLLHFQHYPMTRKICRLLFVFTMFANALLLVQCNSGTGNGPDVSKVRLELKTSRFDVDLYAIDTNHIGDGLKKLSAKYPDFLDYFLDTLMAYNIHGNYNDTVGGIREGLKPFLSFKDFVELENFIKREYPDTKQTDEELTNAFKNLKYYYPSFPAPKIIYVNLGLSKWPAFPLDSTVMCIGLDMFLGDEFPHYTAIGVPSYMTAHLRKSYIPVSVLSSLYRGFHPFKVDDRTLLDLMVQRGKEQYFIHKILPNKPDSVLFGFTQKQVDWCNKNEGLIYNFFIQKNLLYSKEAHTITPYVTDGPYAVGLESPSAPVKTTPGGIGTWLGYRIVSAYMEQHPKMTLAELLNMETDPARILDEAKYRPK